MYSRNCSVHVPNSLKNSILIVLYRPEKEICILNENGMFKRKNNVDRHSHRQLLNDRHLAEPPPFSMYTITKEQQSLAFFSCSREWGILFLGGGGGGVGNDTNFTDKQGRSM
jgi:hypothetical protein